MTDQELLKDIAEAIGRLSEMQVAMCGMAISSFRGRFGECNVVNESTKLLLHHGRVLQKFCERHIPDYPVEREKADLN